MNEKTKERARAIIRANLRNPMVPSDARMMSPEGLLKTRGLKIGSECLVLALLHQVRGVGLSWEIAVSWRYPKNIDPEQAYEAAGLFLKPKELESAEFRWNDSKPMVKIAAAYQPEIEELKEYENLVRLLPEFDDVELPGVGVA